MLMWMQNKCTEEFFFCSCNLNIMSKCCCCVVTWLPNLTAIVLSIKWTSGIYFFIKPSNLFLPISVSVSFPISRRTGRQRRLTLQISKAKASCVTSSPVLSPVLAHQRQSERSGRCCRLQVIIWDCQYSRVGIRRMNRLTLAMWTCYVLIIWYYQCTATRGSG